LAFCNPVMWYDTHYGGAGRLLPPKVFVIFCLSRRLSCSWRTPMVQIEHLPIYKATYDLCLYLE
jgi:hypothetical protein